MSNEWYTPAKYLQAARTVMGSIELDPASCEFANRELVQAERYYTQEQNGLLQEWRARSLWLNPPYAKNERYQSGIGSFIKKLIHHYEAGDVLQAVALVTTEVNAKWFQPLWAYPICFPSSRVKFIAPERNKRGVYSHMFGTAFVYLGPQKQRFIETFGAFGHVVQRVNQPQEEKQPLSLWDMQVAV